MAVEPKKIAAALILLPVFGWVVGWADPRILLGVYLVLGIGLGAWEFSRIAFGPSQWSETALIASGSALVTFALVGYGPTEAMACLSGLFLVFGITYMINSEDLSVVLTKTATCFAGVIMLGLLGGMMVALKMLEPAVGGTKLVIILFAMTWVNDSGAYFAGNFWGKNKLSKKLSPNKTIEGSMGGFIANVLMGLGLGLFLDIFTVTDGLALGVVMGTLGPLGDLFESALKRGAGVKDSGSLIPGHGGVLDRIDSVLFNAPVLYFFVLFRVIG
jgi:phosphatidate cytidylyltransferase